MIAKAAGMTEHLTAIQTTKEASIVQVQSSFATPAMGRRTRRYVAEG
jgi:hypothetical protein